MTALKEFTAIDAAVWFDIARNGFKKTSLITMRDRRMAMQMGRAKIEDEPVSEAQAKFAMTILAKFTSGRRKLPLGPFERPKINLQEKQKIAVAAAVAAIEGRPRKG